MKAKLAGLALLSGMSLAASAATYNFTPIIEPKDAAGLDLVLNLGNQLTMDVTEGGNNTALFTFRNGGNGGPINSVLSGIYFDDSPSNLFSNLNVSGDSGDNVAFSTASPTSPLPGGSIPTFTFSTTHQFDADSPTVFNGVNNGASDSVTLAATLNGGRTFTDVINSLNGGDETDGNFLRVGLRLTAIENLDICGCAMSFLDKGIGTGGGGASPPPPIPEPETYGMLLAGLGLVSAMVRRRKKEE